MAQLLNCLPVMEVEPTEIKAACHPRHAAVSEMRQFGIGWVAPLVAVAGLCMALAGASGWGESPTDAHVPSSSEPAIETNSTGAPNEDAVPPDAGYDPERLVGLL